MTPKSEKTSEPSRAFSTRLPCYVGDLTNFVSYFIRNELDCDMNTNNPLIVVTFFPVKGNVIIQSDAMNTFLGKGYFKILRISILILLLKIICIFYAM